MENVEELTLEDTDLEIEMVVFIEDIFVEIEKLKLLNALIQELEKRS